MPPALHHRSMHGTAGQIASWLRCFRKGEGHSFNRLPQLNDSEIMLTLHDEVTCCTMFRALETGVPSAGRYSVATTLPPSGASNFQKLHHEMRGNNTD